MVSQEEVPGMWLGGMEPAMVPDGTGESFHKR